MNIPHLRGSGSLGENRPGQEQRSRIPSLVLQARKLFHTLHRHPVARVGHQCWTGGRPDRAGMEFWNPCQGVVSSRILDVTAPARTPAAAANPDTQGRGGRCI